MIGKKEHIMNVAESLFNEFGYIAVGVDLIRDKAEVSKTSLYRNFGSKNKLIEAILERRHQRFKQEFETLLAETESNCQLTAIINWHFSWFQRKDFKGCMFMHALSEFKENDELIVEQAKRHKSWLKSVLASMFDSNEANVESKIESLMTFLEGMIIRAEFGDIEPYKSTYLLGAKTLAMADWSNN